MIQAKIFFGLWNSSGNKIIFQLLPQVMKHLWILICCKIRKRIFYLPKDKGLKEMISWSPSYRSDHSYHTSCHRTLGAFLFLPAHFSGSPSPPSHISTGLDTQPIHSCFICEIQIKCYTGITVCSSASFERSGVRAAISNLEAHTPVHMHAHTRT